MTEHDDAGPDVLTRARLAPLPAGGLDSAESVRRRADRRRRRQWAGGTAAAAVVAVAAATVPWVGGAGGTDGDRTVAVDRTGDGDGDRGGDGEQVGVVTADGLTFSLPDGWEVLGGSYGPRRWCVGPADAGGCPVEVATAEDPTVGEDPLGELTEELEDGCLRSLAEVLRILSRSQGNPPASTYEGRCRGEERATTVVALDSGTASATTRDPALTQHARDIVASFVIPDGWRTESRVHFQEADPAPAG